MISSFVRLSVFIAIAANLMEIILKKRWGENNVFFKQISFVEGDPRYCTPYLYVSLLIMQCKLSISHVDGKINAF